MLRKMKKKKTGKRKKTLVQKEAEIVLYIQEFQKVLGLAHWNIQVSFDGTWNWNKYENNTTAKVTTRSDYKSAEIQFHEKIIPVYFDDHRDRLNLICLHELIHVVHAPFKKVFDNAVDVLSTALKSSFSKQFTGTSEQLTRKLEKVLNKEFLAETEVLSKIDY
jgi:hypothetical protein